MQVHQVPADLRQHADRDGAAVHPRAAAPRHLHLALEDQLAAVGLDAMLGQHRQEPRVAGEVERALDRGPLGSGPHEVPARALAQQQRQGVDQQRLPGSRLPGQHVEPGCELEARIGDDRDVADSELRQHPDGEVRQ
jgi:hypothetical protein